MQDISTNGRDSSEPKCSRTHKKVEWHFADLFASVRLKNYWLQLLMVPEAREVKNATVTSIWRNSMLPGIYFIILASESQPLDIELRILFKDQEKITCRLKMFETALKKIYVYLLCVDEVEFEGELEVLRGTWPGSSGESVDNVLADA